MENDRARLKLSFRAKVLIPVITVMVLLMAVTIFVVNLQLTQRTEAEAKQSLVTSVDVFRNSQSLRRKNLFLRFRSLPNEPRYKSALQTLHAETVRVQLATAMSEAGVDFVLFNPNPTLPFEDPASAEPQLQKREQLIPALAFVEAASNAVERAMQSEEITDTVVAGDKLFDIVSLPVYGSGNHLIGVLTFGQEVGWEVAREFSSITHGPIVLLARGNVVSSTLPDSETNEDLVKMYQSLSFEAGANFFGARKTTLQGVPYYYSGGSFSTISEDKSLGFLTLKAYETSLQALHRTQQLLLCASVASILLGTLVVCFVVARATAPLRELRDSAEAVGRGDFSRRVLITSTDECGELGVVFNQMTENLNRSREELVMTVETLKTTQAQLVQSEKLSGIGEFIAGVAHELNNPLASVMGFSELLRNGPGADPKLKRHLDMIHKCALRCQKIVQALLSFARRRAPERKVVCINDIVEAAVEILAYQLRTSNVEVRLKLDPALPQAMVDPHQLQQVFVNLINNARQAIEAHQPKGWIDIASGSQGEWIEVVVRDSGPGITPENLSRIFDPFFTTKEVGKGTGLGLSMCYGIIREHEGSITPHSKPGEGATFVIKLPKTHVASPAPEATKSENTDVIYAQEGKGKRILVIDDEEVILQVVRESLTSRGFEVDVASDGETGLKQLNQASYDVTICDWKMPGLTGGEVYERVRARNPAQASRFIFMTGDVINHKTQRFFEELKHPYIAKPFSLHDFRVAVRRMLAEQPAVATDPGKN